jgi:thiamine-phosphate pyrophosphorylase
MVLVNDRADVAAAAGAAGVHLSTRSMDPGAVRSIFGDQLTVGVSTHSLEEASRATLEGADFATFGPVFETASKAVYGPAVGLDQLERVASALAPFPLIALGGLSSERIETCLRAGAAGVAGISMFATAQNIENVVTATAAFWRDNVGNNSE